MSEKRWNPFELIQVPPALPIDPATLKTTYFEVQKKLHPDSPQTEDLPFTSSDVNEAYQQLKHPGTAAKALLDLKGLMDINHQPHALLEDLMTWEEKLSSVSEEEKETLCSQIHDQQQERCVLFMDLYKKEDLTEQEGKKLNAYALALQYYDRLLTRYQ